MTIGLTFENVVLGSGTSPLDARQDTGGPDSSERIGREREAMQQVVEILKSLLATKFAT